ncbi:MULTISPECIES: GTPase Era [Thiorhodovibrio]|uniref:GTPase Era n=1 Tax=Thiorhodovibrio TaxID=61593 RepID=UPI001911B070|nr:MULTISPECIES: GTPase Era [Thiorhodovibrio]MBK5970557.1 GTPase Era [Thiorhodovibrio winogradskyi]WPL12817.1 GTP-binding protein Era [Thiorhodovibrio litoralis]
MTEHSNRCGAIALIGRPNVGKSTLLNRLLGQKLSITSHKAQTTRDAIVGIKTIPGGQFVFVDTPGIHDRGDHALNRKLNRAARAAIADVDVAVLVVEAVKFGPEDALALRALTNTHAPVIAAINKIDRLDSKEKLLPFLPRLAERHPFAGLVPLSARTGDGVERLEQELLARLPVGENWFPEDQLTDCSSRFLAAELIREQLVRRYGDELPYQTAVTIEGFREEPDRYRINGLIWVERESQKGIIIGRGGEALKATATAAREAMQRLFEIPVHLELWVKIRKGWTRDEAAMDALTSADARL